MGCVFCEQFNSPTKSLLKQIMKAPTVDTNNLNGEEIFPIVDDGVLYSFSLGTFAQLIGGGGRKGGVPSHGINEHNNYGGNNPSNGDILTYNNGYWGPQQLNFSNTYLNDLADVNTTGGTADGYVLTFDGNDNQYKPLALPVSSGTVTSVDAISGTGISVSGGPITTSGSLTITNTAPDQVVYISNGTGINVTGSYPSFTVENTAPDQIVSISAGTGVSVSGSYPNFTVTNSIPELNGTGFVKATGTAISYDNSTYLTTSTASSTYVPYTGATGAVNLGNYDLTVSDVRIGNGAGTGSDNILVGTRATAFITNTTGNNNLAIGPGRNLFTANTTGTYNVALGWDALPSNTEGFLNVAIGGAALNANTTGDYNIGIGNNAIGNITTADKNIGIGRNAGSLLNNNSNNTSSTNSITIGDASKSNGSNTTVIGNDTTTSTRLYGGLLLGTNTEQASSILTMSSTTQGFLPPRMSGVEAEAISSPAEGLMVYATADNGATITSKGWWGFDGTNWVKLN